MALTTCNECGGQMSDKAAACPYCGHPNPSAANQPGIAPVMSQSAPQMANSGGGFNPCYQHNDRPAVIHCGHCGKAMCKACAEEATYQKDGKPLCHDCTVQLLEEIKNDCAKQKSSSRVKLIIVGFFFLIGVLMWICAGSSSDPANVKIWAWIIAGIGSLPTALGFMFNKTPEQRMREELDDWKSDDGGCSNMVIRTFISLLFAFGLAPFCAIYSMIKNYSNYKTADSDLAKAEAELAALNS